MAHTSHPTVFQWTELSKNENDFDSLIVISSAFADAELPELFEGKIKDVLVQAKKVSPSAFLSFMRTHFTYNNFLRPTTPSQQDVCF